MVDGSIVLVHGTGVRLKSYASTFRRAKECATSNGVTAKFVDCAWGDGLGVQFEGKCLPDPPSENELKEEQQDFARWRWLFDDPLFELDKLTIRDMRNVRKPIPRPGTKAEWELLWDKVAAYSPSTELKLLLQRADLGELWVEAWSRVVKDPDGIPKKAFESSVHELAEATHALARAVVAQLHVTAVDNGVPGPSRALRNSLVDRLLFDWQQHVFGPGDFLAGLLKRAATSVLRHHRNKVSAAVAFPIGDILLYQSRGAAIRGYIRDQIQKADPPVTIVAHSLGGIACVDLFALPDAPAIGGLVTCGSQAPLLYELGAMSSIKAPQRLPRGFPRWLNIYDRDDFLSYVAGRLFPGDVEDVPVGSGQPFPDSHLAYFTNDQVWKAICTFMTS